MVIILFLFSELPLNGGCRIHGSSTEALHKSIGGGGSSSGIMKQSAVTGIRQRQGGGNRKFVNSNRQRHMAGNSSQYPNPGQHTLCPEVAKALSGVMLIAEQKKRLEESTKVRGRGSK